MPHLHFISFRINVIATWMTLFYASKLPLYVNFLVTLFRFNPQKILALVLFSANLRKRVFFFFFFFCFYRQESFGFSFNFESSISENIFWDLFSFFLFFLSRSSSSVIHLSSKLQYFVDKKKN